MADKDPIESVGILSRVMGSLRAMTEPKGVDSSVIKDSDREPTMLTTAEQSRLKESANIIGKILKIGAYGEKTESKKNADEGEGKKTKPAPDLLTSPLKKPKVIEAAIKDKMAPEPKKSVDLAKTVIKEKIKEARVTKPISQYSDKALLASVVTKKEGKTTKLDSLSTSEKNRYKEIATIIGNVLKVGKFKEGVEARRLSIIPSTKPQPQPSTKTMAVVKDKTTGKESSGSNWLDWLDTIKKLAGAAGLGALLWKLLPEDWKDKIKGWWDDTLTWLIGDEAKKKLYSMWDNLWNSLFSRDDKDKGIISKWWDDMIASFLGDDDSKKRASDKATNWFDSLWNSAFDKEGQTKDRFLTYWDKIFSLDEGTELNLIQKAALVFGRIIQGSIDITQKSWESSGAAGKTQVAVAAAGAVARGVQAVLPTGKPSTPSTKPPKPPSRADAAARAAKNTYTTGVKQDGTRWFKQGNKFVSQKDVPADIVKKLTKPSAVGKAMQWGMQGLMSAKDFVAGGADKIKSFWNILKKIGSTAKGLAGITKWLLKIPALASLIEYADYKMFKSEQEKLYDEKKITLDELHQRVGDKLVDSVGGAIGATLGSSIGFSAGTALGAVAASTVVLAPIAPFVPFLGAIAGSAAGDYLGRYLADLVISKENAKTIGISVLEKDQVVGPELQDFLVRGNKVYKFSSQDDVLGMKTGGAIDSLMTGLTQNLAKDNSVIKEASVKQVDKLDELIFLMRELIKKPMGGTSINTNNGPIQEIPSKPFNLREQFNPYTIIPNNLAV